MTMNTESLLESLSDRITLREPSKIFDLQKVNAFIELWKDDVS